MAAMTALFLNFPKKYSWTAYVFVALTGLSRMFLVVHYPTDIIGGLLAGALAAVGGWFITKGLLALIHSHDNAFCRGFLSFDAAAPIKRIFSKNSPR
jgi:undecaprenyl-diphosphatase